MTTNITVQDRIWDASITVERVVHLGVQLVGEYIDDDLLGWLVEDAVEALAVPLEVQATDLADALNEYGTRRSEREEAAQEVLRSLKGWLVTVTAPRIDWSEDGKTGSVHTGWRTHRTFYADTYDEALEAALSWGEKFTSPPDNAAVQA